MSVNIPTHYAQQFANTVALLLQQKGSKLRNAVMIGNYVGKQASPVDQIGSVVAQRVTSRFSPMVRVDASTDRRWVFPIDYDLAQQIDSFDMLRLINDPKSLYIQNAMYALGRAMDDEIISGLFGTAKTGETGSTSTSFASGQVVSVSKGASAATGLTVAKLREARRLLMANQVDLDNDPVYAIVKAKQYDNLLSEAQVISRDFNGDAPVLQEGRIARFMGINIIQCERLTSGTDDAAGTSDAIPVFAKSGMHLGIWNDIQGSVSQRNDLQGEPYQCYVKGTFGATRIEENKIVKIWCR
jgi:hypothetical protein